MTGSPSACSSARETAISLDPLEPVPERTQRELNQAVELALNAVELPVRGLQPRPQRIDLRRETIGPGIELRADRAGYVTKMHTSDIGNAAKLLGAGRERKEDALDLSVGIVMNVRLGDAVKRDDLLATLHVGAKSDRIGAYNLLKRSIEIGEAKPDIKPLIRAVVE